MFSIVHLPLSAGGLVMFLSFLRDTLSFVSLMVRFEGVALALGGVADTISLSCSPSVSFRLFFLTANSVPVMRSIIGMCFGVLWLRPLSQGG